MKIVEKNDFKTFVNAIVKNEPGRTVGVKSKGNKFVYDALNSADELRLDFDVTLLPPKKYFFPPWETLFSYSLSHKTSNSNVIDEEPLILIGVHPYDIAALLQMDEVFRETKSDLYYLKKREVSTIIGININNISKWCFADSMGCLTIDDGFDLMLTDLGSEYFVEIGSERGEELLIQYAENAANPTNYQIQKAEKKKSEIKCEQNLNFPLEYIPDLLERNYGNSELWQEYSDPCYSCGSCVMVCPTCYCFDVKDVVDLTLESGQRKRTWDGCLLEDFAKVATGENFRSTRLERYRHRFFKKGKYLFDRFGFVCCVGCGRCSSQCLPDITNPVKVFNDLFQKTVDAGIRIDYYPKPPIDIKIEEDIDFVPRLATIIRKTVMTERETLFEIQLEDNSELGHTPGQFVQVTVFGVGEAPLSVSSSPTKKGSFELCVRRVGNVTSALHNMEAGDRIGIRGPFGNGFPVNLLKGCDIVFMAGGLGIVPLRSLIWYVLDKRNEYGKITILYGCREPCEVLFGDEVKEWEARADTEQYLTVDKCPDNVCWEGHIGVITSLVPYVTFTPKTICATVVGPPIMYKFVIQSLKEMGVADNHILLSLERRMRCAVGKCGHCQINNLYVCKDGPVFNYQDIKGLEEAL
ncbi:MAG: 4Fe-4S dicluster domain-containing protein [Theionarchaea archaeon]|nr:4Fe-4S dicluster domain-containing protein [Theionarchaea archaeon]